MRTSEKDSSGLDAVGRGPGGTPRPARRPREGRPAPSGAPVECKNVRLRGVALLRADAGLDRGDVGEEEEAVAKASGGPAAG